MIPDIMPRIAAAQSIRRHSAEGELREAVLSEAVCAEVSDRRSAAEFPMESEEDADVAKDSEAADILPIETVRGFGGSLTASSGRGTRCPAMQG